MLLGTRTKEEFHALLKELDRRYKTTSDSPLHHDKRCELCV